MFSVKFVHFSFILELISYVKISINNLLNTLFYYVLAHRKEVAFNRWHPKTLGNIFNKKQRDGFEKLATVEVSEDDDDDDNDNDLNVRA